MHPASPTVLAPASTVSHRVAASLPAWHEIILGLEGSLPLSHCAFEILDVKAHLPQALADVKSGGICFDGQCKVFQGSSSVAFTQMEFSTVNVYLRVVGGAKDVVTEPGQ